MSGSLTDLTPSTLFVVGDDGFYQLGKCFLIGKRIFRYLY